MLATMLALVTACPTAPEDEPAASPDPIGDELLRFEGTWALPACARSHLYRDGREVQRLCFDVDGGFSWENRGTLTTEATAALDAELAAADLEADEPVNYLGLCGTPDAQGTVSLWIDGDQLSFAPFCLFEGIVAVYERADAIDTELSGCAGPFEQLESVTAECRAY